MFLPTRRLNYTFLCQPGLELLILYQAQVRSGAVVLSFRINLLSRRKKDVVLVMALAISYLMVSGWRLAKLSSQALLPSLPEKELGHFRRSRTLKNYLDDIQLLIEPSTTPCETLGKVPVVILVTSAPLRSDHRDAIRHTWAKHQPTYFFLGLNALGEDEQLVDNYVEAKQYGDLVVFDFLDHYQNLTIKTALMLQWSMNRCPQTEFVFKTDDDVLVNPWSLKEVLKDNVDAKIFGYKISNATPHRDEHNKWFLPHWLYHEDKIPEYLSGTGYIINGDYMRTIVRAAQRVPLINLEDIYFTYLVAKQYLHWELTDDRRLSSHKPILPFGCAYWNLASVHSLEPGEMVNAWTKITTLAEQAKETEGLCSLYRYYFSSNWFLY